MDAETINGIGVPSIVLMENASRGAADFFARQFPLKDFPNVIVIAGKGNNGGDGLAAGRILFQKGYRVHFIILATPQKLNPDPKINFAILEKLELPYSIVETVDQLQILSDTLSSHSPGDTFLMDAIFGTGLNKPVTAGLYSRVISMMRDSGYKIAAVDIPSGISDTFLPEEGVHLDADATATFHSLKTAHLHPDGNRHCGTIQVIDIGIPEKLEQDEKYYLSMIEPRVFENLTAKRVVDAHKGSYGHSLTICGSIDKPGAGILSSFAVLKSGAGLCTAAVCFENRTLPISVHPELMTLVYSKNSDLLERLPEFNSVLLGPGLGNTAATADVVKLMLENSPAPLVMDADAVNALAPEKQKQLLKRKREFSVVLTPHPGEFSRLTVCSSAEIKRNRIGLSRNFAREFNVYLVLKGHHTLIATPGGRVYVNPTGNPGMATAGSGDVLSGVLAGMISQFHPSHPLESILQAAVFIHGYAGDLAAGDVGEISLTASDILEYLPDAFQALDDYRTPFPIAR